MLRSTPIKTRKGETTASAAAHVVDYLKNEKELVDQKTGYYSKNEAPSMWLGEGAKALGLEGAVDDKRLYELLQGHLPDGTDLSERGGKAATARLGTDITLSASKSYSIMATADPRLVALWDEGVKLVAAGIIEKEIITARLGRGGEIVEHTGKAVIASYRHEDTRMVDGVADMDLHNHLLALNMTQRADGTWARMDLAYGEQMVLAKVTDFALKAWLAERVQKLGYEVRLTEDGWEFKSISQEHIDAFSRRTTQINEWLTAHKIDPEQATDAQREAACLATRESKTQLGRTDQAYEWRDRLRTEGLDLDRIMREARERGPIAVTDLSLEAVRAAARHMGERESVFSRDALRLEALKAGMGGATLATIDAAMADERAGLIKLGGGKVTTYDALYREQEILARMHAGRDAMGTSLATPAQVASVINLAERTLGRPLSHGQKTAIGLVLQAQDRVVGVVGVWGAGKTSGAARPIVEYAKAAGFETVALAPTIQARGEIAGAQADETRTIASWLQTKPARDANGDIMKNDARLIVMDEAAMVDSVTMDAVLQKLDTEGGRLVLVGDPQQLPSVGAGTPFEQAMESGAIAYATIGEVQRQTDPRLKELAQVWGDGDLVAAAGIAMEFVQPVTIAEADWRAAGLDPADQNKRTTPIDENRPEATDKMIAYARELGMTEDARDFETVRRYLDEHSPTRMGFNDQMDGVRAPRAVRQQAIIRETAERYLEKTPEQRAATVVMATTNKIRVGINAAVREGLQQEGVVGRNDVRLTALDKADMTAEKLARPESYINRHDLIVRMPHGRGEERDIVDYKVVGVEKNRVALEGPDGTKRLWNPATAKNPSVYTTREIALAVGDKITFRDSAGLYDSPNRAENGEVGRIERVEWWGAVARMEGGGREIRLPAGVNHPIDHGYCRTVHKSQGMSERGALLAVEAGTKAASQILGVACTRGIEALEMVTDNPGKLAKQIERWAERKTAIEAAQRSTRVDIPTLQELRAEAREALGRVGDLSRAREPGQEGPPRDPMYDGRSR